NAASHLKGVIDATVGSCLDLLDDIVLIRSKTSRGAELVGQLQLAVEHVDRYQTPCADGLCSQEGRESHPSQPHDGHARARFAFRRVQHGPGTSHDSTPE